MAQGYPDWVRGVTAESEVPVGSGAPDWVRIVEDTGGGGGGAFSLLASAEIPNNVNVTPSQTVDLCSVTLTNAAGALVLVSVLVQVAYDCTAAGDGFYLDLYSAAGGGQQWVIYNFLDSLAAAEGGATVAVTTPITLTQADQTITLQIVTSVNVGVTVEKTVSALTWGTTYALAVLG
jgi:hypothetical protein